MLSSPRIIGVLIALVFFLAACVCACACACLWLPVLFQFLSDDEKEESASEV